MNATQLKIRRNDPYASHEGWSYLQSAAEEVEAPASEKSTIAKASDVFTEWMQNCVDRQFDWTLDCPTARSKADRTELFKEWKNRNAFFACAREEDPASKINRLSLSCRFISVFSSAKKEARSVICHLFREVLTVAETDKLEVPLPAILSVIHEAENWDAVSQILTSYHETRPSPSNVEIVKQKVEKWKEGLANRSKESCRKSQNNRVLPPVQDAEARLLVTSMKDLIRQQFDPSIPPFLRPGSNPAKRKTLAAQWNHRFFQLSDRLSDDIELLATGFHFISIFSSYDKSDLLKNLFRKIQETSLRLNQEIPMIVMETALHEVELLGGLNQIISQYLATNPSRTQQRKVANRVLHFQKEHLTEEVNRWLQELRGSQDLRTISSRRAGNRDPLPAERSSPIAIPRPRSRVQE